MSWIAVQIVSGKKDKRESVAPEDLTTEGLHEAARQARELAELCDSLAADDEEEED